MYSHYNELCKQLQVANDINQVYCNEFDKLFSQKMFQHFDYGMTLSVLKNLQSELKLNIKVFEHLPLDNIPKTDSNVQKALCFYHNTLLDRIEYLMMIVVHLNEKSEGKKYPYFCYKKELRKLKIIEKEGKKSGDSLQLLAVPYMLDYNIKKIENNFDQKNEELNEVLELVPVVLGIYSRRITENFDEVFEAFTKPEYGFDPEDLAGNNFKTELTLCIAATDTYALRNLLSIKSFDAVVKKINECFNDTFDTKESVICQNIFNKYIELNKEDERQKTLFDYTLSYFIQQILGDNISKYNINMFHMMNCQSVITSELGLWKWILESYKIS